MNGDSLSGEKIAELFIKIRYLKLKDFDRPENIIDR